MNCKTCKNSCDCKEREAFEILDKLGGGLGKCSGYEPYTKTATEITKETTDWLVKSISQEQLDKERIQVLKEQIEYLEAENERLKTLNSKLEAENYSFKVKERENPLEMALLIDEQAKQLKTAKAEAYKEFANWQEIKLANNPNISTVALQSIIATNDNLLNELVGEK